MCLTGCVPTATQAPHETVNNSFNSKYSYIIFNIFKSSKHSTIAQQHNSQNHMSTFFARMLGYLGLRRAVFVTVFMVQ